MAFDKILYLSYDGLTDPLGQSQILPYMAGLGKLGYDITIVSCEKKDNYNKYRNEVEGICSNNNLQWIPLRYHKSPPVLSSLFDLWRLRTVSKNLILKHNFAIVHCRSYITALVGLFLKRRFSVRFIFDMRGFWADERVEGKLWNLDNPVYRWIYSFFKRQEQEFLQQADAVISLTHNAKQFLSDHFRVTPSAVSVIPCSVDTDVFDPSHVSEEEKKRVRSSLGLISEDFVVIYLGSLGTWYQYDEMVRAFEEIKKVKPGAKFLFLTPDIEKVESRTDFIVRTAGRRDVPIYCSISNLALFFIQPTFSKKASSATKLAEVMAMGLPVITNRGWVIWISFVKNALVLSGMRVKNWEMIWRPC